MFVLSSFGGNVAMAAEGGHKPGGEVNIVLPDLTNTAVKASFMGGMSGHTLLMGGLFVCVLGQGSCEVEVRCVHGRK